MSPVHGNGSYALDRHDLPDLRSFASRLARMQPRTRTQVDLSSSYLSVVNGSITDADFDDGVLVPSVCLTGNSAPRCHIGNFSVMIDPVGDVRPCLYLYDDNGPYVGSDRDKYVMGNVREQPFADIWNGDRYQRFRKGGYPDMSAGSRCRTCEYIEDFMDIDQRVRNSEGTITIGW